MRGRTPATEILEAVSCIACLAEHLTQQFQHRGCRTKLHTWTCQPDRCRWNVNRCASGGKCTLTFMVWCQSNRKDSRWKMEGKQSDCRIRAFLDSPCLLQCRASILTDLCPWPVNLLALCFVGDCCWQFLSSISFQTFLLAYRTSAVRNSLN